MPSEGENNCVSGRAAISPPVFHLKPFPEMRGCGETLGDAQLPLKAPMTVNEELDLSIWVEFGTFCVEETRFPAVVHHLLLALLRSRHQGPELLCRGAVVQRHHVRLAQRGALNRDGGRTVVHQNGPHLFLWKHKSSVCQHEDAANTRTEVARPLTRGHQLPTKSNL